MKWSAAVLGASLYGSVVTFTFISMDVGAQYLVWALAPLYLAVTLLTAFGASTLLNWFTGNAVNGSAAGRDQSRILDLSRDVYGGDLLVLTERYRCPEDDGDERGDAEPNGFYAHGNRASIPFIRSVPDEGAEKWEPPSLEPYETPDPGEAPVRDFSSHGTSAAAPTVPLSDGLVDRLFGRVVDLNSEEAAAPDEIIGFLGESPSHNLDVLARWAGPENCLVVAPSNEDVSWRQIRSLVDQAGLCFVDADFLGDVERTVDLCLRIRNYVPDMKLILISSEIRGHDLTAERSAICDATLKAPLSESMVEAAVLVAQAHQDLASRYLSDLKRVDGSGGGIS